MNKDILVINGSCRNGGNTDRLLNSMETGATECDIRLVKHVLRDKSIHNCIGCYHCYRHDRCFRTDDMQGIHEDLERSSMMILASPMYWWGVTGLMKTFIDRLYVYYPRRNTPRITGKKLLMLVPMNVNPDQHGAEAYRSEIEPLMMTTGYIFKRLGMELAEIMFFPGLSDKSSLKKHKHYLDDACQLGKRLEAYLT